jgi:hypothetical protein
MKKVLFIVLAFVFGFQTSEIKAQDKEEKKWKVGGAIGLDFAQLLFINPKFGAGEDRIGLGANVGFFANYKNSRVQWDNSASVAFGIQRLGSFRKKIPFQKSVDELRVASNFSYGITPTSVFGYSLDFLLLSQVTPTYDGNYLSRLNNTGIYHPVAKFFAPATIVVSPGIAYKQKTDFGEFFALLSPASLKMIVVADDSIAMLGLHGNPHATGVDAAAFESNWRTKPNGSFATDANGVGTYYAKNYIQFGATLKAGWKHKFFKYTDGKKEKHRLLVGTTINLYSNYLREPQNIDLEWITNLDIFLFKGLSISLLTNLSYDHDIMVQVDRDGDVNTGTNGYESTGRRITFMQQLLIKYNFLF